MHGDCCNVIETRGREKRRRRSLVDNVLSSDGGVNWPRGYRVSVSSDISEQTMTIQNGT